MIGCCEVDLISDWLLHEVDLISDWLLCKVGLSSDWLLCEVDLISDWSAVSGEVMHERDRCRACQGKKVVKDSKILEVHIDKGMKNGQKITFRNEGDQVVSVARGASHLEHGIGTKLCELGLCSVQPEIKPDKEMCISFQLEKEVCVFSRKKKCVCVFSRK